MGSALTPGWQAGLELEMSRRGSVTRMTHMRHWGPLRVQRPFYPGDSGDCHLYLLHPPGGMVTGDHLAIDVSLKEGAQAVLTTPSAGKIYRGNQTTVAQQQRIKCQLSGGSYLEWLPQETIVFDGARGELSLSVDMDDESACSLWDIVCLGRPASDEVFSTGYLRQSLEISRNGTPLYVENNFFEGGSLLLKEHWGLAAHVVSGTFILSVMLAEEGLSHLRDQLAAECPEFDLVAVSDLGGLLVIRYLGSSAEKCRQLFVNCWKKLRPLICGLEVIEPRIWRT